MPERHFRGIYVEARRLKRDGEHMVDLLGGVSTRAKFIPTVVAARQFIRHGYVRANGRRVTIPSFRIKVGDAVEVKDKSKQLALAGGDRAGQAGYARLHRCRPC